MVVAPLLLTAGVATLLPRFADAWAWVLGALIGPLGLPGAVAREPATIFTLTLQVPYLTTPAGLPGATHYWIVGALALATLLVSFALPARFLPLAYYLRFAVFIQLTAFLMFGLMADRFPYDLPRYLLSLFHIGAAVLVLLPILLGFTYFPFDVAAWRKVLLTAMCVGHIAVLIPLQVLVHAFVVHHLSLLAMPTLFFLWGVLPHLFVFIAFYGWAMSWPDVSARAMLRTGAASPAPRRV